MAEQEAERFTKKRRGDKAPTREGEEEMAVDIVRGTQAICERCGTVTEVIFTRHSGWLCRPCRIAEAQGQK